MTELKGSSALVQKNLLSWNAEDGKTLNPLVETDMIFLTQEDCTIIMESFSTETGTQAVGAAHRQCEDLPSPWALSLFCRALQGPLLCSSWMMLKLRIHQRPAGRSPRCRTKTEELLGRRRSRRTRKQARRKSLAVRRRSRG